MFRFENLEIWKRSIEVTDKIFEVSDLIESHHHFRFADQLRGAVLSISNNIAEGSGSLFKKEFSQFLNYSHRSIFESVNMLIIACRRKYIDEKLKSSLINELEEISKMVSAFSSTLSAHS